MTPDKATALREAAEAVFSEITLIDACGQICVDGDSIERGVRKALEPLLAERERLREIEALARELVSPAGMVNRGVDRGLVVVERADKSDPHYRLCAALDAYRQALEATDGTS